MQRQSGRRLRESMEAGRRGNEGEVEERSETFFFGFKPMRCYTLSCSFGDDGRLMKGVGASKAARRTPWTGRRRTRRGRENVTTSSKSDEMG